MVKGIGSVRFQALVDAFGSPQAAWQASPEALRSAGFQTKIIENLLKLRAEVDLEQVLRQIERQGIQVLTWDDEAYPARLRQIDQAPPVLYLLGTLKPEDEWAVGIVGTRRITAYGRQVTEELATGLARRGLTIVSGLARGVDGVAHQAALNAGGRTLAILGCGVDRVYPPEHRRLAEQISAAGASDQRLCTRHPARRWQFPAAQPHHLWPFKGRHRRRGRARERRADYGLLCRRTGPRSIRGAGQYQRTAKCRV